MTRAEFEAWSVKTGRAIYVRGPYELVPCRCGDINCHGWKFVTREEPDRRDFAVVPVDAIA